MSRRRSLRNKGSFQLGWINSIQGIIVGIVIAAILDAVVKDGLIPSYFVWFIALIGLWGSFSTISTFRKARWSYAIGWIIAAIILRDLLDPIGLVVNIAVPLIILVYRGWKLYRP